MYFLLPLTREGGGFLGPASLTSKTESKTTRTPQQPPTGAHTLPTLPLPVCTTSSCYCAPTVPMPTANNSFFFFFFCIVHLEKKSEMISEWKKTSICAPLFISRTENTS